MMMKNLIKTLGFILVVAGPSVAMAAPSTAQPPSSNVIKNIVCIESPQLPESKCDDANITIVDSSYACLSISSTGSVVTLGSNGKGSMKFTCKATNNGSHTFTFNCGTGDIATVTSNGGSYTYNCNYDSSDEGKNYTVSCKVDDDNSANPQCQKNISIGVLPIPNCGNGVIEAGEDCDYYGMERGQSHTLGYYLNDRDPLIRNYDFEDDRYSCRNCKIISGGNYVYDPAECLYTDTPISVMNNEIVPFWWKLWMKDSEYTDDESECDNWSDEEKTMLYKPSMECYFAVYNGNHKQGDDDEIQKFKTKCFNENFDNSEYHIYDYFKELHQTSADGASISTVNAITQGVSQTEFGEYKLVLEKVEYEYCNNGRHPGERYGAVCEVNFAVTRPYVMQISTFGANPIGATDKKFLYDFYDMRGDALLDSTDLGQTMNISGGTYASESTVQNEIKKFEDKYEKLAVTVKPEFKVNGTRVDQIFNGATTIKKVPNKNIYFIGGNGSTLTLQQDKIEKLQKAYTIFVDGMDVEIIGDVLQYAMIITTEKMSFKDGGPTVKKGKTISSCASGGQVVQGLFIAGKGFESSDNLWNRDPKKVWCPWGGLHVKGVLIGDGVTTDLTEGKRSQLNSWFNSAIMSSSAVKNKRKQLIIGGAAVLIEYSPSLWKTLPPGAEIFTESLEVYRK